MLVRGSVLLALSLALLACGARSRGGAAQGPDARALVRLERQAQRDMSCRTPLHVIALDLRAFQVDGCGQMREYAWVCGGRRCTFEPIIPAVMRASADLQCAPDQLAGQADGPNHRAFFGCMRGAAYTLMCMDHGCTWSRTQEAVTMADPAHVAPVVATASAPADPLLAAVSIPPPPGAPSPFAAPLPTEVPAPPASSGAVPPPPPSAAVTSDTVVIPPPPS